jgi:murein DD-endopeptidase MepM/ murein hydrolase activator NlpD
MKNRFSNIITIFSLLVMFSYASWGDIYVFAETETELRVRITERNNAIEKLEAEIAAYQDTIAETHEEAQTLQAQIRRINGEIGKLNSDIRLTENRIVATGLEIESLAGAIQVKEAEITSGKKSLAAILQTVYERDTDSLIEIMLRNDQISDFFGDIEQIQNVEESVQERLAMLRIYKSDLEDKHAEERVRKIQLTALGSELDDRKVIEQSTKNKKDSLLTQTRNKQEEYETLVEMREKQRQAVLNEIQQIEDELRKLIDPDSIPKSGSGVLAWPVKNPPRVTQGFGNTPDSAILYNGRPHNGIDIGVPTGTPLYAAEHGVVLDIGDTDAFQGCLSYGKWVIIQHPNNLSTLYAHLSLIKTSKGQSISRGDLIGYSGATGYATGPHLHFTVYDSSTLQFRASKIPGSKCQYLPYGGYLNPLAYL